MLWDKASQRNHAAFWSAGQRAVSLTCYFSLTVLSGVSWQLKQRKWDGIGNKGLTGIFWASDLRMSLTMDGVGSFNWPCNMMLTELGTKFSLIFCSKPAKLVCALNRSKLQQLHLEKQHLEETVKSLRAHCSDMEDQLNQQDLLQQRMKARYVHDSPSNTLHLCVSKLTQNGM